MTLAQIQGLNIEQPLAIKGCPDGARALRMTVNNTPMSLDDLAELVGTNKRSISRALGGSCGLSIDTLIKIMRETSSVFLLQYMCRQMGGEFRLYSSDELELEEIEQRRSEILARRAA